MLPSLHCLPVETVSGGPTLNQRLATLAQGDDETLRRWKGAIKWAKDRASDHVVHVTMPDGREREKGLFDDYNLKDAREYDDTTLTEMVEFFSMAQVQYAAFL